MRTPIGLAVAALMAFGAVQAFAPRQTPPLSASRLALDRMQLNTLVTSKAGLVAGGELGHLLFSTNQGKEWQSASVPNDRQALINQIVFTADGLHGMAVGHEGWILRTADGGLSWSEVAFEEQNGEPLMSIAQLPSGAWITVGAFGRALRSDDDGKTWTRLALPESVGDKHMNRIVGSADGQQWLIVGERGLVLKSADAGTTWEEVPPFYNGSLYNAIALPKGEWLAYGMRGNIFHSDGFNGPWVRSEFPAPVSFYGHAVTADGKVILVGQGSIVATSADGGRHFQLSRVEGRASLTDLALNADGTGWLTSNMGIQPYPTPAPDSSAPSSSASPSGVKP